MKAPRTPQEWQEAVDLAAAMLDIAGCKMYGLLEGGPEINVARCDSLLKRGAKRGITPSANVTDLAVMIVTAIDSEVAP